jgi:hypothetical protein
MDNDEINKETDRFEFENIDELDPSYIRERYDDLTYESVSESLFWLKEYTYTNGLPIAQYLSFSEIFDYFFKEDEKEE